MLSTMGFQLEDNQARQVLLHRREEKCKPVVVVDKVTEARGVNDSQTQPDAIFLDVYARTSDEHQTA